MLLIPYIGLLSLLFCFILIGASILYLIGSIIKKRFIFKRFIALLGVAFGFFVLVLILTIIDPTPVKPADSDSETVVAGRNLTDVKEIQEEEDHEEIQNDEKEEADDEIRDDEEKEEDNDGGAQEEIQEDVFYVSAGELISVETEISEFSDRIELRVHVHSDFLFTNKMTVEQNFFNAVDLIESKDDIPFDEIHYLATMDFRDSLGNGVEENAILFTVPPEVIEAIEENGPYAIQWLDVLEHLWIHPAIDYRY